MSDLDFILLFIYNIFNYSSEEENVQTAVAATGHGLVEDPFISFVLDELLFDDYDFEDIAKRITKEQCGNKSLILRLALELGPDRVDIDTAIGFCRKCDARFTKTQEISMLSIYLSAVILDTEMIIEHRQTLVTHIGQLNPAEKDTFKCVLNKHSNHRTLMELIEDHEKRN